MLPIVLQQPGSTLTPATRYYHVHVYFFCQIKICLYLFLPHLHQNHILRVSYLVAIVNIYTTRCVRLLCAQRISFCSAHVVQRTGLSTYKLYFIQSFIKKKSFQEHDSYRAFRSQGLDIHLTLETKPFDKDGYGPVILLYGSTLRYSTSTSLIMSNEGVPSTRSKCVGL